MFEVGEDYYFILKIRSKGGSGVNLTFLNIKKGAIGDKFYIILEGSVGVYIYPSKIDRELKKVKDLQAGESFGEIALIYKRPR